MNQITEKAIYNLVKDTHLPPAPKSMNNLLDDIQMQPDPENPPVVSKFRFSNMTGTSGNDWYEDFRHENGEYYNECVSCKLQFIGHKRRHTCRKCYMDAKAIYDALSPSEKLAYDEKRDKEIKKAFDQWEANKNNQ